MTGATETDANLALSSKLIERQLDTAGFAVIGRVWDSQRAFDLALSNQHHQTAVVRCVTEPHAADHSALKTMLAEGDFDRAFLVHTGSETDLTGDIPTYPLSRIDELATLLAKASAP